MVARVVVEVWSPVGRRGCGAAAFSWRWWGSTEPSIGSSMWFCGVGAVRAAVVWAAAPDPSRVWLECLGVCCSSVFGWAFWSLQVSWCGPAALPHSFHSFRTLNPPRKRNPFRFLCIQSSLLNKQICAILPQLRNFSGGKWTLLSICSLPHRDASPSPASPGGASVLSATAVEAGPGVQPCRREMCVVVFWVRQHLSGWLRVVPGP